MTDDFRRGLEELSLAVTERHRRQPGLSVPLIARTARRRRRRHESLIAAGAAAVVVLLAVTGSALLDRPAPAPAPPAHTSTPTPSVQPSTTPTATEPVRTLAPKDHPSEPDAWVMTDDTWDDVGPGWALTLFSTVAILPDESESYGVFDPAGTQTLFLVAPDGTTYRLHPLLADGEGSIMWWDPELGTAWVFFKHLGESWSYSEVDLRDGSLAAIDLGPSSRDSAPVLQQTDGRVLWVDVDPYFPASVEGLYWQQTDGSFSPLAGAEIEGDVWLDPARDRVVYLTGSVDGYDLTSIDLTDDSTESTSLGAAPEGTFACSLIDVLDASVVLFCDGTESFSTDEYEVTPDGTWSAAADHEWSDRLLQQMLGCGAPELPWSPNGRELSGALAAQGWSDAWVLPATPGAALSVPKKFGGC